MIPVIQEESDNQAPEPGTLATPIRAVRTRIDGRPTVTEFTVLKRFKDRFEIQLHGDERVISVTRSSPNQPANQALRAYLQG
jgi:hypothetical protein